MSTGNSPVEGEKHTQFCAISPYDCDTDSPSCYDSDSLLDFTGSSQLESVDTLETSVSWYCRGDSAEDEDEAMHVTRSGDRTPLSPNNYLDSPAPLLDSKVFILHPVKLEDDDFDFTCAGLEEEGGEAHEVDRSRSVFRSQQVQPLHQHHHHNHHHRHQPRRNATFSTPDRSRRRWSAPISAFADILTVQTPVSSANPTSSDDDRNSDSDSDVDANSDIQARDETRGRASNKKELQLYSVNKQDIQTQNLSAAMY
ncbi:hypothetical protein Clacol_009975 [Clathrus columnatus]|uniref:Uncharacterized protein n=1 Tax=Clathrus columnatus TaxID=1419009 RepID=A0AAV5API8_9AGAM|nr:hypothetical protein Clacol_009975 [Clathrus columnatus]